MAEEIVGLKIQVDGSDVAKSVGDLRKKIAEAEAQVKQLSDAYGEQSREAIAAQKTLAQLQEITNQKIEQQNQRIDDAAKTVSALSAAYGGVQGALELTGLAGEDTIKQLAKIQSALAIGDAVQNLAEFKGAIKNTFSTFGSSIKSTFSTLRSGLIATGIGAFVVALGLVAANFDTVKKVVLNFIPGLGKVADYIGNLVNKITDFIGVTSEAGRATAKIIAENDKAISSTEKLLQLNADKYDEYTQRKIKANLEYKKNQNDFLKDEKLTEDEKNAYIKQAREKADRDIAKSDADRIKAAKDASKKLADEQKAAADKAAADKKQKEEEAKKKKKEEEEAALNRILAGRLDEENQIEIDTRRKERIKDENAVFTKGFDDKLKLFGKEVEARNAVDTATFNQQKAIADQEKANAEYKKKAMESELAMAQNTLSIIGGLVDQNSAAGKAIAVTQAIINTYQGASKAIAQGGIFGPVAAAATIAAGLINVRKIVSTKIPSATGSGNVGGGSIPSISTSAPVTAQIPTMNTVTQLNQQSINQMGSATGRAYVVESDITNSQEKIIRINRAARLG